MDVSCSLKTAVKIAENLLTTNSSRSTEYKKFRTLWCMNVRVNETGAEEFVSRGQLMYVLFVAGQECRGRFQVANMPRHIYSQDVVKQELEARAQPYYTVAVACFCCVLIEGWMKGIARGDNHIAAKHPLQLMLLLIVIGVVTLESRRLIAQLFHGDGAEERRYVLSSNTL